MKMKCIYFCTHLHENGKKRKKKPKKTKTQKNANNEEAKKRKRIFSRTKTHIFKNEDANSRSTMST